MENNKTEEVSQDMLSKEQVWNILEYADGFYRGIKANGIDLNGHTFIYNPQSEQFNLKDLTNNPKVSNLEEIRKAQANYKYSDELLQEISEFMKFWDGLYNKALRYYSSLLSWNWSYTCINIGDGKNYASPEYKEDLNKVLEFFNKFKIKKEGDKIIKNCLVSDSYYTWFRKSSLGYTLQVMPQDRCKITGTSAVCSYLYDFDLSYFYNATVNIENYDKSLIDAFKSVSNGENVASFVNKKGDLRRGSIVYNDWVRTRVDKGAWCWKFNNDTFNVVPPFTALFKNLFNDDIIQGLQKNKDMIGSNILLWGEMPLKKEELTGTEKAPFKVEARQLGELMNLARKAVSREIKLIPLPLENTRSVQFQDGNSNMSDNYLKSTAGQLGNVSEILFTTDKMSQEVVKNALNLDYIWVSSIYRQMEDFLNYFVNKETTKYKFKFNVSGSNLYWLVKDEQDSAIKLWDKGVLFNESKIASLWNMEAQDLIANMEEAKYSGFVDKLQLMLNTNTFSNKDSNNNGRPTTDENDNTELSREYS